MIKSMTGYGKAEADLQTATLSIEIRTLNGKNADINLRSSLLPKDKELELRSRLAAKLVRGTIDVFLNLELKDGAAAHSINQDTARSYSSQIGELARELGVGNSPVSNAILLNSLLGLPDIIDSKKASEVVTSDNWPVVSEAIEECLATVERYREQEGVALYEDVSSRVKKILALYDKVESYEAERVANVRARILKAAEELSVKLDGERFEQEMIFYLEKYDINEEKVRLRQHCKYFLDTLDNEPNPGRKLGFIVQEMGREINTTGSKANHAEIQKLVVMMKDELEKIREQSMNIL